MPDLQLHTASLQRGQVAAARSESVLEADDELALAAAPRQREGAKPLEEGQDPRVVAADRRDELGDARRTRVGRELPGEGRADPAALVRVGDCEGDLRGRPRPDEPAIPTGCGSPST